jgi:hypothetical protein
MKRLHEFTSPLGEFNKAYAQEEENARAAARLARLNYRNAKREYKYIKQGVSDNPAIADLQQKLHDESYVRRGAGVGAGLGLLGGVAAGADGFARGGVPGVILGSGVGALLGAYGGMQVGGRIRKNKDKNLSANLNPALRELAARSEAIIEFAMVRNADGQFVEVEDESGMGMGTVKAGAGAAAVGGAGYGAYRADRAIMGKYGKQGLIENMDSRNLPSAYAGTTAAGTGAATRGQAYRSALKDISNSATSRVRQGWAAGNAAYNAAGRRASAALPVEGSGFGAKLLRGIRKGLSVATKMA